MRKRKNATPVHGWVILDKPIALTSTQALGKVRRIMDGDKVGHGGTLDPLATGILPLAFGEATKIIPYIMDSDKEYEFTIRWGEQRDTDDAEGKVVAKSDVRPTENSIRKVLSEFTGTIQQTPPAYSAIKLQGERAYDLARAGEAPQMTARPVTIHKLELISIEEPSHSSPLEGEARWGVGSEKIDFSSYGKYPPSNSPLMGGRTNEAHFRVACGKGMYVRSLGRDLAIKLGTYGYVKQLRRTRVGSFTLDKAISLEKLQELGDNKAALTALQAMKTALDDIPGLVLTASEAQCLRAGRGILIRPQYSDLVDAKLVFAEHQGVPVALVAAKAGEFRVVRGFTF